MTRLALSLSSVAALAAILSGLTLVSFVAPLTPLAHWTSQVLPLAYVHSMRAKAALTSKEPELAKAEDETARELAIEPLQTSAWLRIAFIHALRNGDRLDETGLKALCHSYEIDPFDTDLGLWRLGFAFNHWPQLDDITRMMTVREMTGLWSVGRLRYELHDTPSHIEQAAGHLAAGLQMKHLETMAIHH